jgi:glutamate--cysteine ligase
LNPTDDNRRQLAGVEDVHGFVTRVCFKTGPPGAVGIESEWLVVADDDPCRTVPIAELQRTLAGVVLPHGSALTFEPGGQLELSSLVSPDLSGAYTGLAEDLAALTPALDAAGLRLVGQGTDPLRPPVLQTLGPRYDAMQQYFTRRGVAGEAMMASTAAVQLSLDAGADAADVRRRWHLANALLPVLLGAFANSPLRFGRPTGDRSSRFGIWSAIDATRSAAPSGEDPAEAWARHALAAQVMLVRTSDGPWVADPGFTFADWVGGRTGLPAPTEDDLAYHLTTLFPPVRPRGWFEIRYLDALPDQLWPVAVAVTTALMEDAAAGDSAADAAEAVRDLTPVAIRSGVADRRLQRAALRCLALAADALPRLGAAELVPAVETFVEQYTGRGRCPADDVLAAAAADLPEPSATPADRRHALWL